MIIIDKNVGPKIPYVETGTQIFLNDYELMINAAKYQRDWPVHIDVCSNRDNMLVMETGEGLYYVAQIDIPAMAYTVPATETDIPQPIAINMADVTLTLWSTDNKVPAQI